MPCHNCKSAPERPPLGGRRRASVRRLPGMARRPPAARAGRRRGAAGTSPKMLAWRVVRPLHHSRTRRHNKGPGLAQPFKPRAIVLESDTLPQAYSGHDASLPCGTIFQGHPPNAGSEPDECLHGCSQRGNVELPHPHRIPWKLSPVSGMTGQTPGKAPAHTFHRCGQSSRQVRKSARGAAPRAGPGLEASAVSDPGLRY